MQQTIFPIRYGLQVPRGEQLQAVEILAEGGLDQTQSILEVHPGCASALVNFEVSLLGGYRRVNGFFPFTATAVPGTGAVIGVAVYYPGFIIAARQSTAVTYNIYHNTGTSWTKINTSPLNYTASTNPIVQSYPFNWAGTEKLIFTDGVNPAYTWDGATYTVLNASGSAADPTVACAFHGYMFVGGYSSNHGAIKISAPLNEADWNPVDGAAEVVIGDRIVGMRIWRDQLIIFCTHSIYKIVGNSTDVTSSTPFVLQSVTNIVGCLESRSIQECDGDLIFLSQDGIRSISGTFNIGDTEIASISRPIQSIVSSINPNAVPVHALVVHKKTQYRLFLNNNSSGTVEPFTTNTATGVIGSIRRYRDGHEAWEWGQLSGFNVASCTSGYMMDGREYIIAGGNDGIVYQQEIGNTLNGSNIQELYATVPLDLGDRGLRKVIHRVTSYITFEGATPNLLLSVVYDYNKTGVIQPAAYPISTNNAFTYNSGAKYDSATYASAGQPLIRQLVQGSGFMTTLNMTSNGPAPPYTIQGYYVEYFPAARR